LEFRATTATLTSSADLGKSRNTASQSAVHFDPDQPLPEGQVVWKQAYDLAHLLR